VRLGATVQESRGSVQDRAQRDPESRLPISMAAARRATQAATAPVRGLAELLVLRPGPYARAFENLILALIVLSVASIGVEAIPRLPAWATRALRAEEIAVVAVFSLEYLLRIVAARGKLAFILQLPWTSGPALDRAVLPRRRRHALAAGAAPAAAAARVEAADAHS